MWGLKTSNCMNILRGRIRHLSHALPMCLILFHIYIVRGGLLCITFLILTFPTWNSLHPLQWFCILFPIFIFCLHNANPCWTFFILVIGKFKRKYKRKKIEEKSIYIKKRNKKTSNRFKVHKLFYILLQIHFTYVFLLYED